MIYKDHPQAPVNLLTHLLYWTNITDIMALFKPSWWKVDRPRGRRLEFHWWFEKHTWVSPITSYVSSTEEWLNMGSRIPYLSLNQLVSEFCQGVMGTSPVGPGSNIQANTNAIFNHIHPQCIWVQSPTGMVANIGVEIVRWIYPLYQG